MNADRRSRWRVRGPIAAVLFVAGIALIEHREWEKPWSPEPLAQRLEQTYGLRIRYGNPKRFWVPPFTAENAATLAADMKPVKPNDAACTLQGVESALQQYPSGFVKRFIEAVFISGELKLEDEPAGGTYGQTWIILSAPPGYSMKELREQGAIAFNHELSSFVLASDADTLSQWLEFSPAGWDYADGSGESLRRANKPAPPLDTGFLSAYGGTTPENDFNVYAQEMFGRPERLACLAQDHPLVRRKLDFVMATYVAVDPSFQARFQKMGLTAVAEPRLCP